MAGDPLMRELGRRQMILATYDVHGTGVVEDNIDGGQIVAGDWFKIAHPMALKHCLNMIAWQPEVFAPPGENHIVRSTTTIEHVRYEDDRIIYRVASAPEQTAEWLRLSYRPASIKTGSIKPGDKQQLSERDISQGNGYMVRELQAGDYLVAVRHDDYHLISVEGKDLQQRAKPVMSTTVDASRFSMPMRASQMRTYETSSGTHVEMEPVGCMSEWKAAETGATLTYRFTGRSVRVLGLVFPKGGLADVYLDGFKQLAPIDCWSPEVRVQQTLFCRNGLENKEHEIKILVRGESSPVSQGNHVVVQDAVFEGGVGTQTVSHALPLQGSQRWILGYPERTDYIDSERHAWRPATEWVVRAEHLVDSVAAHWWTSRRCHEVDGTSDPELYRYGAHAKEFWANFTMTLGGPVAPATGSDATRYHVRLKFAETRNIEPKLRAMDILINGKQVVREFDIASTAAGGPSRFQRPPERWSGLGRAVDLVFNDIEPANGVIEVRFKGSHGGEAIVQAIEVGPGHGGVGATPATMPSATNAAP
jgi:hypothetical protein